MEELQVNLAFHDIHITFRSPHEVLNQCVNYKYMVITEDKHVKIMFSKMQKWEQVANFELYVTLEPHVEVGVKEITPTTIESEPSNRYKDQFCTHQGESSTLLVVEDEDEDCFGEDFGDRDEYEERIEQSDFDRGVDDHEITPNPHVDDTAECDEDDADATVRVQHVTNTTPIYESPAASFYANTLENMDDPEVVQKGVDNAIIMQETIHTISKKRGKVGYMAIKVDLEKAYDKLEWGFIHDTLLKVNLHEDLMVEEKCRETVWKPIKTSRNGIAFSHLFFADDLVFFAKADATNCSTIRDVLNEFCSKSGQMQIPGVPIKHKGRNSHDFNFVLDRVKNKVAGWKANLLSFAGRTVLVQTSSTSIPVHVMQCNDLPAKLLENIDRVNRNFLWGFLETEKKVHWVGWNKITKAKEEGGLSIHSAKGRNLSLLAKLNWRFHTEEALWANVLKSKYCTRRRLTARNPNKLPKSNVWAAISKGEKIFEKGTKWILGRESNLSF
ncbi:uncharacterized protein LOC136061748 [Quercus suber]|uniref:uncharacterized protein LOC136061748 n=1 Tax=Quercus suber TaxID=58331 RepID=UPI0032DF8A64